MKTTPAHFRFFDIRLVAAALLLLSLIAPPINTDSLAPLERLGMMPTALADNTYASLASGNFTFSLNAGSANLISSNDNWSNVPSVEGYYGQGLTATHGVDPQTILGTEFAGNSLPNNPRQVNANKGNPSAYNAGGITEFDSGSYLAIGFQGNVQANPYLVFYLNSTGRSNVTFNYDVIDIDGGSNNAVSPLALQYRVGNSGNFTNIADGFIADTTQGPNIAGLTTSKSVVLPPATWNQAQVQVRLITTNAANTSGGSTPDEWIGVNNVSVTSLAPSSAQVTLSGRVMTTSGAGLSGAIVTLVDEYGITRQMTTGTFGYFKFSVSAGKTYIVGVVSRRYVFDTQVLTVEEDFSNLDFYALGGGRITTREADRTGTSRKGMLR
jgi:hypothetical protein